MNAGSMSDLLRYWEKISAQEDVLRQGGGEKGWERQRKLGRLTVRERLGLLLDDPGDFFELGLWAGYEMYPEWGEVPAAGVVTGIGEVAGRTVMVVANDATVKAGAFLPQSVKKLLRAQRIAFENSLPILYLVDSAGAFLPMQDEVFPDEDDFGRIFRNNAVLSAAGIPQYAAIMGNCVAGGAYLPVLCDKILMTEGSGLYLAGPSLVEAAIGERVDAEDLGGAALHDEISGTIDFREPDDKACLHRLRALVQFLPDDTASKPQWKEQSARSASTLYDIVDVEGRRPYEVRELIDCLIDEGSGEEYKSNYGKTIVTMYARIGGRPLGIVANQKKPVQTADRRVQVGGVIYAESADKAARFVLDCNQMGIPLLFLQDVQGFMVGSQAEKTGIIRSGAKLVNAVSNCVVPKITLITGGSFGAGNYAMCGKAYDPRMILAWPHAKYAVMGAQQASNTLFNVLRRARERQGGDIDQGDLEELRATVKADYEKSMDIRYGAARGWVDAIIAPDRTREILVKILSWASRPQPEHRFHSGVWQV